MDFKILDYAELKESIVELYDRVKDRDYCGSTIKTVGRCLCEYEMTMKEGETERILCPVIIGILTVRSNNRVFVGQHKIFELAAKDAILKQNELDLTREERIEVVKWANELLEKLPLMEIEHDPRAK